MGILVPRDSIQLEHVVTQLSLVLRFAWHSLWKNCTNMLQCIITRFAKKIIGIKKVTLALIIIIYIVLCQISEISAAKYCTLVFKSNRGPVAKMVELLFEISAV